MLRHIEVTFSLATEMCIKKIGCCSHQWLTVARLHAQVPRQLKHYSRSVNQINLPIPALSAREPGVCGMPYTFTFLREAPSFFMCGFG